VKRAIAALAAGAVLSASGCGGDDRLSEEEFREQANSVCADYEDRIRDIGTPTSVDEIPAYVDEALPVVEQEIEELKALSPPSEQQETFDEMIAEAEKAAAVGPELREAAEENDRAAIERALDEGNAASDRADEHARELGLTACVDEE
jgi:hypothetical protein